MFSLDRFYDIIHNNLIDPLPLNASSVAFHPFGTYDSTLIYTNDPVGKQNSSTEVFAFHTIPLIRQSLLHCYFFDQEPFYEYTKAVAKDNKLITFIDDYTGPRAFMILANSEKSDLLDEYIRSNNYYNWYYFFHGFAALDWYRDFQYVNPTVFDQFDKVFICYNHLISKYRSYRLHLVSNLINQDLIKHGRVSLFLSDNLGTWQDSVEDPATPLDDRARAKITSALSQLSGPLIIDTDTPTGSMSANVDINELTSVLWHVVTETVYFLPKLHLTEKVFKPIVARRPFILAAAPGNLAYLKSYGFRTFDQWIDESYDEETDHYIRIEKITAEIQRLCELSPDALKQMHSEMKEILEYNHQHFYGKFKDLIVNELVDNFEGILNRINHGRIPGNHSRHHQRVDLPPTHFEEVKKRLAQ